MVTVFLEESGYLLKKDSIVTLYKKTAKNVADCRCPSLVLIVDENTKLDAHSQCWAGSDCQSLANNNISLQKLVECPLELFLTGRQGVIRHI